MSTKMFGYKSISIVKDSKKNFHPLIVLSYTNDFFQNIENVNSKSLFSSHERLERFRIDFECLTCEDDAVRTSQLSYFVFYSISIRQGTCLVGTDMYVGCYRGTSKPVQYENYDPSKERVPSIWARHVVFISAKD